MPLTAEQLKAHPGFQHLEWDLPPTKKGRCEVAKNRRGGPFQLYYEFHGSGQVKIVWILGLGTFRTGWKRQTRYFGHERSSTYTSLVFDNRGMGLSDKPTCRYSTSEMAKDALDLLDSVGWLNNSSKRDLNIVGLSMGGMIAQELALLIPDKINSLCLQSTAPRLVRTISFVENLRNRINMFVPKDMDVQLHEAAQRLISSEFLTLPDKENSNPEYNFPTIHDRFAAGELSKRLDVEGFTRKGFMLQAIAAGWHHKSAKQLQQLGDAVTRQRIAVCHGTADQMITFEHAELFKDELGEGIEYRVFPGLGHVLMWEAETEFNEFLRDFIDKCNSMEK